MAHRHSSPVQVPAVPRRVIRVREREKGLGLEVLDSVCEHARTYMRIHPSPATAAGRKDLRRLPHVHSKVLELPLPADTDVAVIEGPDAFHYVVVAAAAGGNTGVRTRTVRIHPGVVKAVVVVVQPGGEDGDDDDGGGMELDRWRSRLPESSCPAMAVAGYVDGQLVVTVPKGGHGDVDDGTTWSRPCNGGEEISGRLVVVQ